MPTIQQLIAYLNNQGYTSNNSTITAADLAEHFDVSDGGVNVPIRDLIRQAIQQGELIGSNNQGFYLIGTLAEVENYLTSLENRAEQILLRRRNILNNWNNQNLQNQTANTDLVIITP